jgi:hypothetical protein
MKLFSAFKRDNRQTLNIGSNCYSLQIPQKYLWEYDAEGTLLFYPKGDESITIRVTVLSFEHKDGKSNHGSDIVLEKALSNNFKYEILSEGLVLSEESPSYAIEEGTELIMQYWYLGLDNSIIIFSSTILEAQKENNLVKELTDNLPEIFRSVTTLS